MTNPTRASLVSGIRVAHCIFDRYLEQAAARIAELALVRNGYEADVRSAISEIGAALWDQKVRSLDLVAIRLPTSKTLEREPNQA